MNWIKDDYAKLIITNLSDSDLADEEMALHLALNATVEDYSGTCLVGILDEFGEFTRDEIMERFCKRYGSKVADNGKEE